MSDTTLGDVHLNGDERAPFSRQRTPSSIEDFMHYIDKQHEAHDAALQSAANAVYRHNKEDIGTYLECEGEKPQSVREFTHFMISNEGEKLKKTRGYWTIKIKDTEIRIPHLFRHYEKKEYTADDVLAAIDGYQEKNEHVHDYARRVSAQASQAALALQAKRSTLEDAIEHSIKERTKAQQDIRQLGDVFKTIRIEQAKYPDGSLRYEQMERKKNQVEVLVKSRRCDYDKAHEEYRVTKSLAQRIQRELRGVWSIKKVAQLYEIQTKYQRVQFEVIQHLTTLYAEGSHLSEVHHPLKEKIARVMSSLDEANRKLRSVASEPEHVTDQKLDDLEEFLDNVERENEPDPEAQA